LVVDVCVKYNEYVDELQRMVDMMKEKLQELDSAGEDTWEHLKEGIEGAWNSLGTALKDTTDKFKK